MSAPHIVVVGAGAFGGWTALELAGRGARVTLLDAWGPGNARASSGGETRVIRASYGSRAIYTQMAVEAARRWRDADAAWGTALFRRTGGLWMFTGDEAFGRDAAAALDTVGLPHEWLSPADVATRHPQIATEGLSAALWEPDAGVLHARLACQVVADRFVETGGVFERRAVAAPVDVEALAVGRVRLNDGGTIQADAFAFACGPWLGTLFPDAIGDAVVPTRQEVYYFGPPAGDARFTEDGLPVWVEFADRMRYGIPGNAHRGFKFADDTSGERFDPTSGSRALDPAGVAAARAWIARRFPALADAPLVGGEVCQYEATPDSDFLIDRLPGAASVWVAGGGSGHGFKMGPVVGRLMADAVLGASEPDSIFGLARVTRRGVIPSLKEKWT